VEVPAKPAQPVAMAADELETLQIDISAGFLVIQPGTEYGLTVQGELPYKQEYSNGHWKLTAYADDIDVRGNRFYLNGKDVTTTFILSVPESFDELELQLDMGAAEVRSLTVQEAECITNLGAIDIMGLTAEKAILNADLGSIEATGISVRECEATSSLGHVNLTGDVYEKLVAKCELGSINGRLARPADYGWDMEADMGSINLDGHSVAGMNGSSEENSSADTFFDLTCGLGNINIQFV
jgi:DUF4097 and DUF4098 domain-containing protein YvlB